MINELLKLIKNICFDSMEFAFKNTNQQIGATPTPKPSKKRQSLNETPSSKKKQSSNKTQSSKKKQSLNETPSSNVLSNIFKLWHLLFIIMFGVIINQFSNSGSIESTIKKLYKDNDVFIDTETNTVRFTEKVGTGQDIVLKSDKPYVDSAYNETLTNWINIDKMSNDQNAKCAEVFFEQYAFLNPQQKSEFFEKFITI